MAPVFALWEQNNCTALESSKVGYACALGRIVNGGIAGGMNAVSGIKRRSGNPLRYLISASHGRIGRGRLGTRLVQDRSWEYPATLCREVFGQWVRLALGPARAGSRCACVSGTYT